MIVAFALWYSTYCIIVALWYEDILNYRCTMVDDVQNHSGVYVDFNTPDGVVVPLGRQKWNCEDGLV